MDFGEKHLGGGPSASPGGGLDIWVKGRWAKVEDDSRDSDIGLLWAGIDYRVSPSLLFGMLAQFDWADEIDTTNSIAAEGHGWMVGPYMVKRIGPNLLFDGRVAFGESDNEVNPLGLYTDDFDTDRWLAKARLTGDYARGNWRFSPHVGVIYFEEDQDAYTDSLGIFIPGQIISLGRVTFGPKISHSRTKEDGSRIGAHLGLRGIWDFDEAEIVEVTTGLATGSSEGLRGRLEGGLSLNMPNVWSLSGDGFYDGIGADDLEARGGGVRLKAPLN
jgi:outer membrane autotransporter protein